MPKRKKQIPPGKGNWYWYSYKNRRVGPENSDTERVFEIYIGPVDRVPEDMADEVADYHRQGGAGIVMEDQYKYRDDFDEYADKCGLDTENFLGFRENNSIDLLEFRRENHVSYLDVNPSNFGDLSEDSKRHALKVTAEANAGSR